MKYKMIQVISILCMSISIIYAQETCEAIVQQAIETASENCDGLRRNEACYGNVTIDAEAAPDVEDFVFASAGDIANVSDIASMRLSSQVEDAGEWGISLMNLQANLPDDTTGTVSMVLFGDVDVENDVVGESVRLPVTALSGVNVRRAPVDGAVVGSLANGEESTAIGRNEDGSWVLVEIPDTGDTGWVAGNFVTGDDMTLPVLSVGENSFGPMQAFYFTSGSDDAPCGNASESGILLQTPEGAGTIEFSINEVTIELGSTAFLQTVPNEYMYVSVLEGQAIVSAFGLSVRVPAGATARIPVDTQPSATDEPEFSYYLANNSLPIQLLTTNIAISDPFNAPLIIMEPINVPNTGIPITQEIGFFNPTGAGLDYVIWTQIELPFPFEPIPSLTVDVTLLEGDNVFGVATIPHVCGPLDRSLLPFGPIVSEMVFVDRDGNRSETMIHIAYCV